MVSIMRWKYQFLTSLILLVVWGFAFGFWPAFLGFILGLTAVLIHKALWHAISALIVLCIVLYYSLTGFLALVKLGMPIILAVLLIVGYIVLATLVPYTNRGTKTVVESE